MTTNQDGTTKTASYSGCGCATGGIVTLTDEMSRQQKSTVTCSGRQVKIEMFNWDGTVYSTRTNSYNARIRFTTGPGSCQGLESTGIYQEVTQSYDGYGRLVARKDPIQTTPSSFTYYPSNLFSIHSNRCSRGNTDLCL